MNISQELAFIISEALHFYGIEDIVISPGSRNAPLVNQFIKSGYFNCSSCVDERSAGFKALGIAIAKQKPVVLTCTSGTAMLNYLPAVCEAYYQGVPLVVLSADRPQEWIDQGDGQTIRQQGALGSYVTKGIQLNPPKSEHDYWLIKRSLGDAFCSPEFVLQKRPIHINCSFEEPLYGSNKLQEKLSFREVLNPEILSNPEKFDELAARINQSSRVLWIVGQLDAQAGKLVSKELTKIAAFKQHAIISETTSNLDPGISHSSCIDRSIVPIENDFDSYQPEVLIHLGGPIVSKKIKQLLRGNKAKYTVRIHNTAYDEDTFMGLNLSLIGQPPLTLAAITKLLKNQESSGYNEVWSKHIQGTVKAHDAFMKQLPYSDLMLFRELLKLFKAKDHILWGNSSVIRYAQLFEYPPEIKHLANRGTSGIEGLSSTANGYACAVKDSVYLVSGDISFFYDINGLDTAPENLKVILINNGGGNIFRIINGPDSMTRFEDFLETHHNKNAKHLAAHFGFKYLNCDNSEGLAQCIEELKSTDGKAILEVFTPRIENPEVLASYFKYLKNYSA